MEALSVPSSRISDYPDQLQAGGESQSQFKLVLVHDGYQHLDRAINDLQSRSIPAHSEVLLLPVSDLFRTPLHLVGKDIVQSAPSQAIRSHSRGRHKKTQAFFDKLESVKRQARATLQAAFPDWDISFEQPLDWQPNLIYFGAYNQSSVTNPGLSEIIRKLTTESNIPFIVARQRSQTLSSRRPTIIAFDGSASGAAILTALQRRPTDGVNDLHLMFFRDPLMAHAERGGAGYAEADREWIESQLVRTKTAIEALGHRVSCSTAVGHTAQAILEEAKRVDAESIILGTEPLRGLGSLSAQSIAVATAVQAECSVEIAFSAPQERPAAEHEARATPQAIVAWKGRDYPRRGMGSSA